MLLKIGVSKNVRVTVLIHFKCRVGEAVNLISNIYYRSNINHSEMMTASDINSLLNQLFTNQNEALHN